MSLPIAGRRRACLGLGLSFASFFIAGCTTNPRAEGPSDTKSGPWSGRLALRLDSLPPQSFSASFQLSGQATQGELSLFTPIGSTAAAMAWGPGGATLRNGSESRAFSSLEAMVAEVTGTPLPVAALFDWLAGRPTPVPGWEVDLTRLPQGRLMAQRFSPQPQAELRLILD